MAQTQPAALAVAAAVALGLACGVKWSGLWFVVAFGLLTVFWDLGLRRQHGQSHVWLKTLLRDAIPAALVMLPIVFVTYVATWYGWFTSSTATCAPGRSTTAATPGSRAPCVHWPTTTGGLQLPHRTDHRTLVSVQRLGWPVLARPTSFFTSPTGCSAAPTSAPRKSLLWATRSSGGQLPWRCSTRYGVGWPFATGVLVRCCAASWRGGPWLLFQERTVFSFYSIVFLPFMIMALTLSFGSLLGSPSDTRERRGNGAIVVVAFLFRRGGHVVVVLSHLDRTDHHVRAVADADVVADLGLREIAR